MEAAKASVESCARGWFESSFPTPGRLVSDLPEDYIRKDIEQSGPHAYLRNLIAQQLPRRHALPTSECAFSEQLLLSLGAGVSFRNKEHLMVSTITHSLAWMLLLPLSLQL